MGDMMNYCGRCGDDVRGDNYICASCKKKPIDVSPYLQIWLEKYNQYGKKYKPEAWAHEWFDGKKWILLFYPFYPTKKEAQRTLWTRWPDVRGISYSTDIYNEQVAKKHIPLWFRKRFRVKKYKRLQ
jgi:hypothetical protein